MGTKESLRGLGIVDGSRSEKKNKKTKNKTNTEKQNKKKFFRHSLTLDWQALDALFSGRALSPEKRNLRVHILFFQWHPSGQAWESRSTVTKNAQSLFCGQPELNTPGMTGLFGSPYNSAGEWWGFSSWRGGCVCLCVGGPRGGGWCGHLPL